MINIGKNTTVRDPGKSPEDKNRERENAERSAKVEF